ncbi:ribonuclease [Comamonas sp.]|uniref:ribonuclease n=1 Tax=Comamonas sp. TaxID=34028 RepID=UPI0028975D85|nr:ribonuclease [Comamonas sp.]
MRNVIVRPVLRAAGALVMGVALVTAAPALQARGPLPTELPGVSLAELPSQARTTYRLILKGGPFPYDKDGTVFGNRERLLPASKRGYYREYTVKTPWSRDRGARRIVCGGEPPTQPQACYYTSDHYNSFRKITP